MKKIYHVIVSHQHTRWESYWCGKRKGWNYDISNAKRYASKNPTKSAIDDLDFVQEHFAHANPMFKRIEE